MLNVKLPDAVSLTAGEIVGIGLQNAGATALAEGVATFSQTFRPGDLPAGASLTARIAGAEVPVQMSVKTTHPDGSVKTAVIAVARPELPPGGVAEVTLAAGPAAPAAPPVDMAVALAGRAFTVDIIPAAGEPQRIDVIEALTQALAEGRASFWQQGPLASEARISVDLPGSQRLVLDVTVFADGEFKVNAQFNNDEAMTSSGGRANYTAVVTLDGVEIDRETVSQAQYQNWRETYTSDAANGGQGSGAPEAGWLNIRHDVPYLESTGAVPQYDTTLGIRETKIADWVEQQQAPGWGDPLANNGILQLMGAPGAREDLGTTTAVNSAWLMSQDPRVAKHALDQAEVSGAVPWNTWDTANNTWLNTDDYPRLWTDPRGGTGRPGDPTSGGLTQQIPTDTGWGAQRSHQPDLSFVPYVLTGERMHLDAVQAQASFSVMNLWPALRQNGSDVLVANTDQLRSSAWSLRQIEHAAWSSPDGSPEKAYFQQVSADNWALLASKLPEWTAAQGEAYGRIPGQAGTSGNLTQFGQDYFASVAIVAASRGNEDALTVVNWMSNYLIGRFLNGDNGFNPRDGVAYQIATRPEGGGDYYKTWAEIGEATVARGLSNGTEGWDASNGEYGRLAMASLAGIWHLTGNPDALEAYKLIAAESPPFTTGGSFASRPNYAITIPGIYGGVITGTTADDRYDVGSGSPFFNVDLGEGLDTLTWKTGTAGGTIRNTETIRGGDGNDTLTVEAGTGLTSIDLAAGLDRLQLGEAGGQYRVTGVEILLGGAGDDAVTLGSLPAGMTLDLGGGNNTLTLPGSGTNTVTLVNVQTVIGGAGSDRVTLATALADGRVELGAGLDSLTLFANGPNTLSVSGVERITGGLQADDVTLLAALSGLVIDLGSGADRLQLANGTNSMTVTGVEMVLGGSGADSVTLGTPVFGIVVRLGGGTDRLQLAKGTNTLTVAEVETITGGTGSDSVTLDAPIVGGTVRLGGGTDRLILADGTNVVSVADTETILGAAGNDTVNLLSAATGIVIDLGAGGDRVNLANTTNTLTLRHVEFIQGGTGADTITLGNAVSGITVDLGAGTDRITLFGGNNDLTLRHVEQVQGAGGNDVVTLASAVAGATVDLGGGNDRLVLANGGNTLSLRGVETLVGGSGNDAVTLSSAAFSMAIDLGAGTDTLTLAAGQNILTLAHVEQVSGNIGNDAITFTTVAAGAVVSLGAGNDRLVLAAGPNVISVADTETIQGGAGNDTVTLTRAGSGILVDLNGGDDRLLLAAGTNGITVRNVERIEGSTGADTVTITTAMTAGLVDLGSGSDRLVLAGGNNTLTVRGVERIEGGAGTDVITFGAAVSGAVVELGSGGDRLLLADGTNSLSISGVVHVTGGAASDSLTLTEALSGGLLELRGGSDRVVLATGTNTISFRDVELVIGGGGVDRLTVLGTGGARLEGRAGDDRLVGGDGADQLIGGTGRDILTGGAGADRFHFRAGDSPSTAPDQITDFDATSDRLVFEGQLLGSFSFRGAAEFKATGASQARFVEASRRLEVDANGNGLADTVITLTGVTLASLSASDFLWS
jgi:Ca2+-binding RTX toxin-like protein